MFRVAVDFVNLQCVHLDQTFLCEKFEPNLNAQKRCAKFKFS